MHLVDDENLISSHLWRNASLLHQRLDILNRVVACRIKFEDVVASSFVERLATLALVARFALLGRVFAVDGLGKNACASGLSYASGAAEKVGVGKFSVLHGVHQSRGKSLLSHHGRERHGSVFSCRNDIFVHSSIFFWCCKDNKK